MSLAPDSFRRRVFRVVVNLIILITIFHTRVVSAHAGFKNVTESNPVVYSKEVVVVPHSVSEQAGLSASDLVSEFLRQNRKRRLSMWECSPPCSFGIRLEVRQAYRDVDSSADADRFAWPMLVVGEFRHLPPEEKFNDDVTIEMPGGSLPQILDSDGNRKGLIECERIPRGGYGNPRSLFCPVDFYALLSGSIVSLGGISGIGLHLGQLVAGCLSSLCRSNRTLRSGLSGNVQFMPLANANSREGAGCHKSAPSRPPYRILYAILPLALCLFISYRFLIVGDVRIYFFRPWFLLPFAFLCGTYGFSVLFNCVLEFFDPGRECFQNVLNAMHLSLHAASALCVSWRDSGDAL